MLDTFADLFNHAGELVAEGEGKRFPSNWMRPSLYRNEICSAEVLVDIGAADATERWFNLD